MLSLHVYDTPARGEMLADLTPLVHPSLGGAGFRFSTGRHGYHALQSGILREPLERAFSIYDWPGTPHLEAVDEAGGVAWEGRIEDITLKHGGAMPDALGYWRALYDAPYTALWSDSSYQSWRPISDTDLNNRRPEKFAIDQDGRLFIGLRKDETYPAVASVELAALGFWVPHNGERDLAVLEFDYVLDVPTDWRMRVETFADDLTGNNTEDDTTSAGSQLSGSKSITLAANKQAVLIQLYNTAGSAYTWTGETGDAWLEITNVRVKTTTAASVLASDIASALATYVNGVNSDQLSAGDGLIEATTLDLYDELYEDAWPADILDRLAYLHGYEVGVWGDRRLHFRDRGSAALNWYVDVTRIVSLQRSIERLRNSAYAVYKDATGRLLRTAVSDNDPSQTRYGLTRRGFVKVRSTDSTEAIAHRDAWLTERQDLAIRATVEFERLYDESGGVHPLHAARAGDTLTMRNLPPSLGAGVDNVRSFTIGETEYNAGKDELSVSPEDPIPTLITLAAKPAHQSGSVLDGVRVT